MQSATLTPWQKPGSSRFAIYLRGALRAAARRRWRWPRRCTTCRSRGTRSCKSSRWIGCRSSPRAIRTWRSCSIPPPQSRSRQHEGGDATAHRAPDCAQGRQGLDRGGLQGGRVRRRGNRLRGQHGRARDHGRHVQHRRGLSVCHDARRGREDEAGRMGALHLRQYGFRRHQRLHHEP
ncbi:FIG00350688: hypothetical protein [Acinetobacter baumannii]|nr:hypothetical protein ACINBC5_A0478 [Acinetobacter baumannii Canada BC-5]EKA72693.1 hypothetical protein ACINIS58_0269 [Acinetobacter baumannii IS-58]EKK11105.1 hypothetical protein ACINIS235_0242 [Acinetobacter baumannii IS-235]EKP62814.1 hypothetical protein ACINCANBC1_0293 [Acinetobacter baumannii Canada BC1]KLT76310.1 hypothetical protein T634_0284 [Acinetobacter baumannii MRSN 7339]KLT90028.1 hypothetical protein T633_0191 [Acinetobacter baumannii MRSN 58]CQR68856.1 FIG00350688: hypoth